jgi:hypothetical protein
MSFAPPGPKTDRRRRALPSSTGSLPRAQHTCRQVTQWCETVTTQLVKMPTSGYLTLYIRPHILRVEYSD